MHWRRLVRKTVVHDRLRICLYKGLLLVILHSLIILLGTLAHMLVHVAAAGQELHLMFTSNI